ncbi:MAG: acetyl-CoA carboxylase biotin carboxyl carrier protein [Planctomycetales bacterium]|nr:acetyl-CoA carboxylase biotin carboxyl carrier protein [Planctomycetales bacterium]
MSSGGSGAGDVFDVRKVRRLVELMNEHDLGEIDLRQGDQRIRLRRGQEPQVPTVAPSIAAPLPAAPVVQAASDSPRESEDEANVAYITSPMVGTFYSASSPDSPPFVKVGDSVGPDSIVCILEAMKVFNEIPAECSGSIGAVLVQNGDAIEFGQKLFKVQTN